MKSSEGGRAKDKTAEAFGIGRQTMEREMSIVEHKDLQNSERLEKSKAEVTKEMGYTRHEVSDYQRMAHNQILDKYTKLYENNLSIMFNLLINIQIVF